MQRIVLASGNAGKLREMRALLAGCGFEVLPQAAFGIEPPHEDGSSFVDNALIKARHAARIAGLPAIADDSGLVVDALGGRPGIHSARFAGEGGSDEDNNAKLLAELANVPPGQRGAHYCCVVVFVRDADDPAPIIREGRWEGSIGFERRGNGGFGYDPVFIVAGDARTVAEMPAEVKNRVSHRAQALNALVEALNRLPRT